MVMSWSKFLQMQNRLKAAAQQQNVPWVSETEETTTPETNPIQEPTQETTQTRPEGLLWNNKLMDKITSTKAVQKIANSKIWDIVTNAATAPYAEEAKAQYTQDIQKIEEENKDIKAALYGEWNELEDKTTGREKLADRWDRIAEEDGVTRTDMFSLWIRGTIKNASKLIHKYLPQSWQDNAGSWYLSDWRIVAKQPVLQRVDNLNNAKKLAASIQYAYGKDGYIVDAKTIKEKVPEFADVDEDDLQRFINWCLYNFVNRTEIDREKVAEKFWWIVKSDEYMSKKSAISDLLLSETAYIYWMDDQLEKEVENDPELQKVIKAYQYIWMYADRMNENWYNMYDSSARGLAETYKDYWIDAEEAEMSLQEAYDTIANYKWTKLDNYVNRIEYNLQNFQKSREEDLRRIEQRPGRWNTRTAIKNFWKAFVALADDFENWSVQTQAEAKGRDPGRIFNTLLVEQTWTDEEGNIRDMKGDILYERHEDGSYVDKKGNNVTDMINGTGPNYVRDIFKKKPHAWLFWNMAWHIEWITQWVDKTMENLQDFGGEEDGRRNVQNYLWTANGAVSTWFQTSLLLNPKFIALETLPGSRQTIDVAFSELANLGSTAMIDFLTVTQLANKMDEDSINEARELWGTVVTIMAMKKRKKETDPYKKAFKEAVEKTFEKYKDRMVEVTSRSEASDKIKEPFVKEKEGAKTPEGPDDTTPAAAWAAKRTEVKEPTKTEAIWTTDTAKSTEKVTAKAEGGKDLGYTFTVNRATISEMIKDFKEEYKKAVEKDVPESSILRSLTEFAEEFKDVPKDLVNTAKGMTFSEIVENIQEGMQRMWNNTKEATQRITDKLWTRATRKRQADAYEKMKLSGEEVNTLQNNSKVGKLWAILNRLVSSKRWKITKEKNVSASQVEKMVRESVAKDRINEQVQKGRDRLQERKKIIQKDFYQKLSSVKNISFWKFFTGENWLKKALSELFRGDTDAETYINFREVDGKIIMKYRKWYSAYFDEYVAPELQKLVKEYNDMVENGQVSEQNLSKINDSLKNLRKKGEGMIKSQDPLTRDQGKAVFNAANNIKAAFMSYLEETGTSNKLLVWEKASKAIADLEKLFSKFTKDGKIDESKARGFLEKATDEEIAALEELGIETSEYIDLIKNGSTALSKIFSFQLSLKDYKSKIGEILGKRGRAKSTARGKAGTLTAVILWGVASKILAGIGILGMLTAPLDKALWKLANKTYQNNLRKALNKTLKDPRKKKQLVNILEGLNDTIEEIDKRVEEVIKKRTKQETPEGPELWTPENPIVWEAPEQKKALPYREDPEAELNNAISDLETQTTDALRQLNEMVKDSYRDKGEDTDWPDDTTPPTGPTGPDKGGNWEDPISEFIKIIEWDTPEGGEGKPDFSKWSNESLSKLFDKNGDFKKGVPEEYKEEISNEMTSRTIKQEIDDSEVRTQNNIIRAILKQLDQIAEWKAEDNIREKYNEQVMQAWNVDTNRADEIIWDIVNWVITESDVYQDKTTYEDNQEASNRIEKRTGKKTKTTKSASKTSSLEVRDTKPDSQGKLNALKTQLEQKKKALPKVKSAKTLQKKQAEIDKLEKEITRIEEKLWAKPLDSFDIADKEAVDNIIAEEEKPQVQPSEEKISEPQKEQSSTMDDLMTFKAKDKSPEEIKNVQAELTKRKNENNLEWYSVEDVDKQIRTLNKARIGKQNEKSKKEDVQEVEDAIQEDLKALSEMAFETVYQGGRKSYEQVNLQHVGEWEWVAAHGFWIYVAKDPTVAWRYLFSNREYVWKELSPEARNMLDGILLRMSDDRLTFKEALEAEKELMKEWWADGSDVIKELEKISQKDLVPVWAPDWTYKWQNVFDMDSKEWDILQDIYAQAEEYANEYEMNMTKKDLQRALDNYITNEYGEHSKAEINIAKKINVDDFWYTTPTIHEIQIPKQQKAKTPTWELYLDEDAIVNKKAREQIAKELEKQPTDWIYSKEALKEIREKDLDWRDLYIQITRYLWEQEYASEFLRKQGYGWIKYTWWKDGECYVIFGPESTQVINKFNKDNRNNFSS